MEFHNENFDSNQPTSIEENRLNQTGTTGPVKKMKKLRMRGFLSTLAAGVIGSALTLAVLPNTDYLQNFYPETTTQQSVSAKTETTSVQPVSAQAAVSESSSSLADIVENVSKTIVGIVNYQQPSNQFYSTDTSESVESGSGSGVIFQKNDDDAYIVTNNHVIEGATSLEVSLYDGQKVVAEVVGADALTDLAVLKIEAKCVSAVAEFGDSTQLRAGDQVYAIGNPLGLDLSRTVTQGIVSATNRTISITTSAGDWETSVIQTDAAINAGNSGGALINSQGQVIGINSLKIADSGVEGLGFAIPSSDFIPIINQLIEEGEIDRPYLGVGLADLDQVPQMYLQNLPDTVTEGAMVTSIDSSSAASRAGLQEMDVIVSMNGTEIGSSTDLRKYLYTNVNIGNELEVGVYRDGKLITIKVVLAE